MGWFDESLVLLKQKQVPKSFLLQLHKKLENIDFRLEIDDNEFIVFNDTHDKREKEIADLNKSMRVNGVIDLLCEWPGLGLLSYRHPNFDFAVTINYLSWADKSVDGFTIGFNGREVISKERTKEQLITNIIDLVDYKYVVGDIGNVSNTYIDLRQDLSEIIRRIKKQKFQIDRRREYSNKKVAPPRGYGI